MNLPELIAALQEAHAKLGNHPNVAVRFEAMTRIDDEDGTVPTDVEVEARQQLVVIRG